MASEFIYTSCSFPHVWRNSKINRTAWDLLASNEIPDAVFGIPRSLRSHCHDTPPHTPPAAKTGSNATRAVSCGALPRRLWIVAGHRLELCVPSLRPQHVVSTLRSARVMHDFAAGPWRRLCALAPMACGTRPPRSRHRAMLCMWGDLCGGLREGRSHECASILKKGSAQTPPDWQHKMATWCARCPPWCVRLAREAAMDCDERAFGMTASQ